jgi:hypothetical protein
LDNKPDIETVETMWSTPDEDQVLLDADCSPTKTCRNMVDVSFDGLAEPGSDLSAAWRATLEREGKLKEGSGSVHDLVFRGPGS